MTRELGRYGIGRLIDIGDLWCYVAAALLWVVPIEPVIAGMNTWTAPVSGTAYGTTVNPIVSIGGIAVRHGRYLDAQVAATPTTGAKCSNAVITAPDFAQQHTVDTGTTLATYDSTAPLICTEPKLSTQAGWTFTQDRTARRSRKHSHRKIEARGHGIFSSRRFSR